MEGKPDRSNKSGMMAKKPVHFAGSTTSSDPSPDCPGAYTTQKHPQNTTFYTLKEWHGRKQLLATRRLRVKQNSCSTTSQNCKCSGTKKMNL